MYCCRLVYDASGRLVRGISCRTEVEPPLERELSFEERGGSLGAQATLTIFHPIQPAVIEEHFNFDSWMESRMVV